MSGGAPRAAVAAARRVDEEFSGGESPEESGEVAEAGYIVAGEDDVGDAGVR